MASTEETSAGSSALEMITDTGNSASPRWRMNSMPSIPGISRSLMMMSIGGTSRLAKMARAILPSAASLTCFAPRLVSMRTSVLRWKS